MIRAFDSPQRAPDPQPAYAPRNSVAVPSCSRVSKRADDHSELHHERKTAAIPADRDRVIQLPQAQQFSPTGYCPMAYCITWDEEQREYRIALTQLVRR
ncbi:MAG TPA: hypothetical protein VGJ18_23995 [Gemmatimonadaceae bacterium]